MPSCVWRLLKSPWIHGNRRLDVFITPIVACSMLVTSTWRCSKQRTLKISMSRTGNPYDNAHMESFFKTLKYEEAHLSNYETFDDVIRRLPHFIALPSNLGENSPVGGAHS